MKAVQILMDEKVVELIDREARRRRSDRSKLVRSAIELFLAGARRREHEGQYVEGYTKRPIKPGEVWEQDKWPET